MSMPGNLGETATTFEAPEPVPSKLDEVQQRYMWRLLMLIEAGCPEDAAHLLAERMDGSDRIDWHDFAHLRELGCPAELAGRILL